MTPADPTLGIILKEVREMRAELQEADAMLSRRLTAIDDKQAVANGRTTKLEIRTAELEATQRERFALKRELFVVAGAFAAGVLPSVLLIVFHTS